MSADLVRFVEARIAEDEAEVGPFPPYPGARDDSDAGPNGIGWGDVGGISEVLLASHRRVLRQCEAFRRIVAHWPDPFGEWTAAQADAARAAKEHAVRTLASIWADHPEFRQEWAA